MNSIEIGIEKLHDTEAVKKCLVQHFSIGTSLKISTPIA